MKIKITVQSIKVEAELHKTQAALAVFAALPVTSTSHRWGEEVYFEIPLELELQNGREVLEVGDVAYWPPGKSMCIFFGPTPSSKGNEVRAYSAVNVLGKIIGDATVFATVNEGDEITVEKSYN